MKNYVQIGMIALALAVILTGCKGDKSNPENQEEAAFEINNELTEAEKEKGILTPEILWKYKRIGDVQLSPDGTEILLTLSQHSLEHNKGRTQIFKMPVEGGEAELVSPQYESAYNPRWVAEGQRIAFLKSKGETHQIFEMNVDGSALTQMSNEEEGVNYFEYSPDGKHVFFTKNVKLDDSPEDIYPDLPKANVHIAEHLMYRHWNRWHDFKYSHIFVAEYAEDSIGSAVDIMEGEKYDAPLSPYFDHSEIRWSPDGKYLAYCCKKMPPNEYTVSTNSDIYLYNIADQTTVNLSDFNPGYDKYPVFSNNSDKLAWQSMKTPGYESDRDRMIIMDMDSKEHIVASEDFDQSVGNITWSEDDSKIYFISGHHATYQVYEMDAKTYDIRQVTEGRHNYNSIQLAADGLIATRTTMERATEIFKLGFDGSQKMISDVNAHIYDNITMGEVRKEWVETTDGKQMLVWLILPPKFDENKEYPAILYCQGGPQSAISQFFSYRWNFQIMAANGYVVIAPNRRGLPSFGPEWNEQISGDYGGQNMKDYFSAVDAMTKKKYIDGTHVGAVGASYGGFSVFWLAGHHEGRFNAFISHCGMFNLESQYNATDEYFFVNHDLGGPYWGKDDEIIARSYANSPHRFVDKWDTPILIVTGENDFRIPYTESLQAFNAAQLNGVPSKLLVFPGETHFVLQPQNAVLWQREFKGWLDTYLK